MKQQVDNVVTVMTLLAYLLSQHIPAAKETLIDIIGKCKHPSEIIHLIHKSGRIFYVVSNTQESMFVILRF